VAYRHNRFLSRIDIDNGVLVVTVLYNARDLDVAANAVGWLGALLIVVCTVAIPTRVAPSILGATPTVARASPLLVILGLSQNPTYLVLQLITLLFRFYPSATR
jgi:hypothetical protein